jgi:serine/threonine protein kinase
VVAMAQTWIRGRLLGAGAFGSVNLAINRESGQVFAVKSVAVTEGAQVAVRAIENEIALLQALDSRHVVRCLGSDWTEEGGESMRNVFLEYMPDGCLTDFVKQFASGAALEDEHLLRRYTRSVVEGIEYLHSRGIVHCDIKGKNILVGNGVVKLTDFGSAKRVEQGENCATAKVNGTPLWMAPEVVRQVEQGPASDIWSLGCTVVEMATGRAPWSNLAGMNHFVALYHIGCTDELPAAPAWLSADARDFLSHCFERDPRRRWTSAQLLQHPFLTTRYVAAAAQSSSKLAPASPVSVLGFESLSDSSCFVHNSVPILAAAPSLLKRGLVSAQDAKKNVQSESPSVEAESDWWNCHNPPGGHESTGPWIVVRSPKTRSPSSSLPPTAFSDWMSPVADSPSSSAESLILANGDGKDFVSSCETSECLVQQSCAVSASSLVQNAAGLDFCYSAMSDMDGLRLDELVRDFDNFSNLGEERACSSSLRLGFSIVEGNVYKYSELVNQYLNPQILLYWCYGHTELVPRRFICSVVNRKRGHSDRCIIQLLDEYTLSLNILEKRLLSQLCVCVSVLVCHIWLPTHLAVYTEF